MVREGWADISLVLENPGQNQRISGIGAVSGWTFSSVSGARVSVRMRIDGVDNGVIPCCSERSDVLNNFPNFPQASQSGFGLLFNFNNLTEGTHTLTIEVQDDAGSAPQIQEHTIVVAKPGGFDFLSELNLDDASTPTIADDKQSIVINKVKVTDKATEKVQEVNLRLAWSENSQTLGVVQSDNVGNPSAGADDKDKDGYIASVDCDDNNASVHPFALEICDDKIDNDCNGLIDSNDPACKTDSGNEEPAIKLTLENPPGSLLSTATISGIGLVSGWVFTTTPNASITNLRLRVDGSASGDIPCCSDRSDVQTAFPTKPQALHSGFGALVNFSKLDSASHTITVEAQDSAGVTQTVDKSVETTKLGNSDFLDMFDLSNAKPSLVGGSLELENVTIRDKATQQTMQVAVNYVWEESCQCFTAVSGCGDGTIQTTEECDGITLGGETCMSLGFTGGSLSCRPRCAANDKKCTLPCVLELKDCTGAPLLYVANATSNTVSVIDTRTLETVTTIRVGQEPRGIAVTPDGAAVYVANFSGNTLSVIDRATNTVKGTINVGKGPAGLAISPDGQTIYTVNGFDNTVSVVDRATSTLKATIAVGREPQVIALTADGLRGYVTNFADNSVSVLNLVTNKVTNTFLVGKGPDGIAISPDGKKAYVVNSTLNSDEPGGGTVSVVDTTTNKVTDTIQTGLTPTRVIFSPDGEKAYVADSISDAVIVIDTAKLLVATTLSISSTRSFVAKPEGMVVTTGGKRLFVALFGDGFGSEVEVFTTITNAPIASIRVGDGPYVMAITPAL
jgi:YVTN family beta-propeller protein